MLPDDPIKAIALAVSATVLFGSSDTISKYLSGSLPIIEFIWIRYVLFLITAACLVRRRSILPRNPACRSPGDCASSARPSCSSMACGR